MVIIVAFYVYNQCILLLSFCRQLFFYDTFCVIKSSGESFFHPFQLYAQFLLLAACKKQQHDEADLIGTDPAASDIFIICKGKVVPFVQKLMHYYLIHVLNWVRTDRVWKLLFFSKCNFSYMLFTVFVCGTNWLNWKGKYLTY